MCSSTTSRESLGKILSEISFTDIFATLGYCMTLTFDLIFCNLKGHILVSTHTKFGKSAPSGCRDTAKKCSAVSSEKCTKKQTKKQRNKKTDAH